MGEDGTMVEWPTVTAAEHPKQWWFKPATSKCPACDAVAEQWWSYCAMCGWHIASGDAPRRIGSR